MGQEDWQRDAPLGKKHAQFWAHRTPFCRCKVSCGVEQDKNQRNNDEKGGGGGGGGGERDGCWGIVLTGLGTASPCPTMAPATPAPAAPAPLSPEASTRAARLPALSALCSCFNK